MSTSIAIEQGIVGEITIAPYGQPLPQGGFRQATLAGGRVEVTFEGGSLASFGAEWLRDSCPCDLCRFTQTDERRWQPWVEDAPEVVAASVEAGVLHLVWSGGHHSAFTADAWQRLTISARRGNHTQRFWRDGYQLERHDYDDVLAGAAHHLAMFEAFRRDGAVIVTGAPTVPGGVIDFAKAIGIALVDSSLGFIFDVVLDPAGFNVAYTSEALPPHNDNAQYIRPPSGQILSFIANDATGGDSLVVDGWTILDQLRRQAPWALDVLSRIPVGHRQYSTTADGFSRNPLVVIDADGRFRHLRFSNQLKQPLPFDHPELDTWYAAYRLLGRAITDRANQVHFRMNAGEMLLVNGFRVLHARTAFVPDGARHLQDVYFNVDDVDSVIARLTGEAPNAMLPS